MPPEETTTTDTETTTTDEPTSTATADATSTDDTELGEKGKAALAAERKRANDAEKALKAERAEREKLAKAAMSEHEKAIAEAEERGTSTATKAFGERLAAAKIEAALTGVVPDPSAVVEDLNLSRYITEDGEVDADKVAALKEKYAAFAAPGTTKPTVPGVPAGARATDPGVKQLSKTDLKSMSAEEISKARKSGQLVDLMAGT